jgi:soluble lytic murein transglycosylase-like protein
MMAIAGHRMFGVRQFLGLGVVLVTLVPAYAAYRVTAAPAQLPSGYAAADRWNAAMEDFVEEVAARHGVPKNLVLAVIAVESQFDPQAVSARGAIGLMQLMPATAQILGVSDPFDPRENIQGGVRHLRALMDRFDNNLTLALAAYNAGAKAVITHGGVPPYRETRQYVKRVLRRLDRDDGMSLQHERRRALRS